MFSNFKSVIDYFDSFYQVLQPDNNIRSSRLERMKLILSELGNPERSYKTIHLAGSKGKGSTAAYICQALTAKGEKTGLYLSPHLVDYRERFTLNGLFFSDEELLKAANELEQKIRTFTIPSYLGSPNPTTFELYTAYAYILFKNAECTYAVIETGLGGRLDATNTLSSICQVILPIELEHTSILGDTIEKIAFEKAKIIKPGSFSFIGFQHPDARSVFAKEAREQNNKIHYLDEYVEKLETETTKDCEKVKAILTDGSKIELNLKMRGEVQAQNALLSILVCQKMGFYEKGVTEKSIENVQLPGRFEKKVYKGKTLIFDVAHTKESVKHTISSFNRIFPQKQDNAVIYASIEGKDTYHMLKTIMDTFDRIVITKPGTFKKSDPEEIVEQAQSLKQKQEIYYNEDNLEALEIGLEKTKDAGALLIIGSFYLAGSIMEKISGPELQ